MDLPVAIFRVMVSDSGRQRLYENLIRKGELMEIVVPHINGKTFAVDGVLHRPRQIAIFFRVDRRNDNEIMVFVDGTRVGRIVL